MKKIGIIFGQDVFLAPSEYADESREDELALRASNFLSEMTQSWKDHLDCQSRKEVRDLFGS